MQPLDIVQPPLPRTTLDYWREHRIIAVVWPETWTRNPAQYSLAWQKVRFSDTNRDVIPQSRGIYCFAVSIENAFIPVHGYIAYVGITGDKKERTLRDRYGDYLRDRRVGSKRPKLREMFNLWGEHLDFWYCPFPDRAVDLGALERELNTILLPPFVENDFEAWAKPDIKLLRAN